MTFSDAGGVNSFTDVTFVIAVYGGKVSLGCLATLALKCQSAKVWTLFSQKSPRMTFSFWTVSAASSQFIRPHTDFSQTSRFSLFLRPPLYFILLKSLIIRRAFFSCRRSTRVTFYIHHKSDAAVAIFTLSPIIIVYRQ